MFAARSKAIFHIGRRDQQVEAQSAVQQKALESVPPCQHWQAEKPGVYLPERAYDRIRPRMLSKPRVIMFDWGGTLVHTHREREAFAKCAQKAVEALAGDAGCADAARADNLRRRFVEKWSVQNAGSGEAEFDLAAFFREWAEEERVALPERLDGLIDAWWRPWVGCLEMLEGVRGALERLKGAGIALGLVSNCATVPHVCRLEVERQGIDGLLVFSLFSSELGVRKPHPRVYATALARAERAVNGHGAGPLLPGDVLFVGDTPVADVAGPARAGMKTALVRTGNWRGDQAELTCPPDLVLDSVHGLADIWT